MQSLKQPVDLARLGINVHIQVAWGGRQSGDRLDVGRKRVATHVS